MVTLAEGLADRFDVIVEQHNRFTGEDYRGKALYTHPGHCTSARWAVVLRDPRPIHHARERFRNATFYLHSHDLADRNLGLCFQAGHLEGYRANVCVSQWHRGQTIDLLKAFGYTGTPRIKAIYNTLASDVVRTGEPYDKNKLIWLASPHKGLARAYEIFKRLIALQPEFRLWVTNPGYMEDRYTTDPEIRERVMVLGTIPHAEAVQHLRNSLCLFNPNTAFPETFGKILAEANEVGTPVLYHPIGAASEVTHPHPKQRLDCRDTEAVVKRVLDWYNGERPIVWGNPKFKLSAVVQEWTRLLTDVR